MGKKTVRDVAFKHPKNYAADGRISGSLLDELVVGAITRATSALENDLVGYQLKHRRQISDVFKSLLYTHRAIRRFLKEMTANDPEGVDSLALLRL